MLFVMQTEVNHSGHPKPCHAALNAKRIKVETHQKSTCGKPAHWARERWIPCFTLPCKFHKIRNIISKHKPDYLSTGHSIPADVAECLLSAWENGLDVATKINSVELPSSKGVSPSGENSDWPLDTVKSRVSKVIWQPYKEFKLGIQKMLS